MRVSTSFNSATLQSSQEVSNCAKYETQQRRHMCNTQNRQRSDPSIPPPATNAHSASPNSIFPIKPPHSATPPPITPLSTTTARRRARMTPINILRKHTPPQRTRTPLLRLSLSLRLTLPGPRAQVIHALPRPRRRSRRRHHRRTLHHMPTTTTTTPITHIPPQIPRPRSPTQRTNPTHHPLPAPLPITPVRTGMAIPHRRRRDRAHGRVADLPQVRAVPLRQVRDAREDFVLARRADGGGVGRGGGCWGGGGG